MERVGRNGLKLLLWTSGLFALARVGVFLIARHYDAYRHALALAMPNTPVHADRILGSLIAAAALPADTTNADLAALGFVLAMTAGTLLVMRIALEVSAWAADLLRYVRNGDASAARSIARGLLVRAGLATCLAALLNFGIRWENLLLAYANAASAAGVPIEQVGAIVRFTPGEVGYRGWLWLVSLVLVNAGVLYVRRCVATRWDQFTDAVRALFRADGAVSATAPR